jgi:hypothetical protein
MINRIGIDTGAGTYRPPKQTNEESAVYTADRLEKGSAEDLGLIPRPKVPHGGTASPMTPSTNAGTAPPMTPPAEGGKATSQGAQAPMQTEVYQGNFNGKSFTVGKPSGWTATPTPIGIVFSDPQDPKTSVSFSWFNGMGQMNPQGLINGIASQMGISDMRIVGQKVENAVVPQAGQVPMLFEEVTFKDREGARMHALAVSQVGVIPGVFMPSWFGSLSVAAAPEEKWPALSEDLKKVLGSFALKA